jgi:hypothetical protein
LISNDFGNLLLKSRIEPSAEHFSSLSIRFLIVWNELLALLEPFLQGRKIFENVWIKLAFDQRREVGHEDNVGQRKVNRSSKKSAAKGKNTFCGSLTVDLPGDQIVQTVHNYC